MFGLGDILLRRILDITLCAVGLRIIMGWLLAYPRLLRLIFTVLLILLFAAAIYALNLPFAMLLTFIVALPVSVLVFLSFLPELSRIYQAASRGNLFRPKVFQSEETLAELSLALVDLVKQRTGALFVFCNRLDAESLISGGEEVSSTVNRSLILSIFNPHCPRHDGAAVIRSNRITRVGGVLPLATAEGVDAELGTRHLAAIGLTQRSDAHVIVVSEERGIISHVHDGVLKLVTGETPEELERELLLLLGVKSQDRTRKRHRLMSIGLWILALAIAALGSVETDIYKKKYFETPSVATTADAKIEFSNIPPSLFISEQSETALKLFMRVPPTLNIVGKDFTILLDMKNAKAGKNRINLTSDMIRTLPKEAQVDRFDPAVLAYTLSELRTMMLDVQMPEVTGLKRGLRVHEKKLDTVRVKVLVRDPLWKPADKTKALPVDLSSITAPGTYTMSVTLNVPQSVQIVNGGNPGGIHLLLNIVAR
ncbi:MAG: DNA integrity scanning protein DisA nucleotide-binding domain protein [Methylacidiphilales bacterium]|nr:DNA integrity scanning protein DisA nucleotide-binding domain protein [Candidatus Methylacidiphilales bacterium]